MKRAGRIAVFVLALAAVGTIVGGGMWAARRTGGVAACSLGSLGSPEEVVLESYIQMHAEELARPAGSDDTPVTFVIEPGETAMEVAQRLQEAGLVSDAELFRRYLQYEELDAGLEAGTFTLRQTMTIPEIALALQSGQRPDRVVTIREGLRLEEVAAEVSAQTGIPEPEFLALVTAGWRGTELSGHDFLASLPPTATLEGFLLPETYRLPEEAAAYDVVARMLTTFGERVTPEMRLAAANRGLSVYEMVTLASIVEREAVVPEERPIIAGVYFNRLEAGWLLNADPTVQYGLGYDEETGQWWRTLYFDALGVNSLAEVDHPYNTYRYPGLPPGPICSPGLASLEAVAYPADTDYFYFIADCHANDGSHLFAVTEEEHYANYAACGGEAP
ncbi:MAG TPA: endolytic transglycosylase MltG [Anaerolineales bacterium]|nr:endolytic transglycosylase MltG [Anaerolineae bacterium]HIQ01670.1 endolytic transglycosylase MltG [Anaerolineales bacterium]